MKWATGDGRASAARVAGSAKGDVGLRTDQDIGSVFMTHPIYRVTTFTIVGPYTLRVAFDDQSEQCIDFRPVLAGEIYAPLRDLGVFNKVFLDPEVCTLVWPNGADFDPATLHDLAST